MPLNEFFPYRAIQGKDVYVVDDHHKVLTAWALVRRSLLNAPNLIKIDHRNDQSLQHPTRRRHLCAEQGKGRASAGCPSYGP